jgi:glutathione synthase
MLDVAVQMDPLDKINFASDSTFALMLEAAARGHRLWFYTPDMLSLEAGRVSAPAQRIEPQEGASAPYALGESKILDLADVDVVLLRQDPPFDLAYVTSTHLLERVAETTLVVNDPAHVRNAPEKIFVTEFTDLMPPTLITRDKAAIQRFRETHGEIVMKPLYGHGGASVFKISARDPNFGSLYDLFATTFREPWVVQRFLPRVVEGDKRILLVEGEALGAVNRVPAPDDIRSNMVRGGVGSATELSPREREICARLAPHLEERGLLFVGIDVIDGWLTEINVTSPTGLRALRRSGGPDLAPAIWDAIERRSQALRGKH